MGRKESNQTNKNVSNKFNFWNVHGIMDILGRSVLLPRADCGPPISLEIYTGRTLTSLGSTNSCTLVSVGGECSFSGVVLSLFKLQ